MQSLKSFLNRLLLVFVIISPEAWSAELDSVLSKSDRKRVQTLIGYVFKDPTLLDAAFRHSGVGGSTFEALEAWGDPFIRAIVAETVKVAVATTAADVHAAIEPQNTNAHFARRYQALGFDAFLAMDPTDDKNTVCANALEALVAAVAQDYFARHPHLRGTGKVFKTLAKVVHKLVLDEVPVMPVSASTKGAKVQVELVVQKGAVRLQQKGGGTTAEEAQTKALKALWSQLDTGVSSKRKTFAKLQGPCQSAGWTVSSRRI